MKTVSVVRFLNIWETIASFEVKLGFELSFILAGQALT
jgi:hypothetical protein